MAGNYEDDDFSRLPFRRAREVRRWLNTPLGACRICGDLVYPTDPRSADPAEPEGNPEMQVVHLACCIDT